MPKPPAARIPEPPMTATDVEAHEAASYVRTAADRPAFAALGRAAEAQQAAVQAKYLRDCAVTARR